MVQAFCGTEDIQYVTASNLCCYLLFHWQSSTNSPRKSSHHLHMWLFLRCLQYLQKISPTSDKSCCWCCIMAQSKKTSRGFLALFDSGSTTFSHIRTPMETLDVIDNTNSFSELKIRMCLALCLQPHWKIFQFIGSFYGKSNKIFIYKISRQQKMSADQETQTLL